MEIKDVNFDAFAREEYFWLGKLNVPWLATETEFLVKSQDEEIAEVQRDVIRFVCGLPLGTRHKLATRLFTEYQTRIYNSLSGGASVTPPVKHPDEIWALLTQPGITVPELKSLSPDCQFATTFECPWDPEHGLAILFNRQGTPTNVGSSCDFG